MHLRFTLAAYIKLHEIFTVFIFTDTEEQDEDLENGSVKSDASNDSEMHDADQDLDEDDIDDEFQNLSDIDLDVDEDDISDLEFNDDIDDREGNFDDSIRSNIRKQISKHGQKANKKIGKSQEIDSNIFVSAEKFAEMLEENSKQKGKHGGTNVFSTTDGAGSKQIEWEKKRHHKLKGSSTNKNKRKGPNKVYKKNVKKIKR